MDRVFDVNIMILALVFASWLTAFVIVDGLSKGKGRNPNLFAAMTLLVPISPLFTIPVLLAAPVDDAGLLREARKQAKREIRSRCPYCYRRHIRNQKTCWKCGRDLPKERPSEPQDEMVQVVMGEFTSSRRSVLARAARVFAFIFIAFGLVLPAFFYLLGLA